MTKWFTKRVAPYTHDNEHEKPFLGWSANHEARVRMKKKQEKKWRRPQRRYYSYECALL